MNREEALQFLGECRRKIDEVDLRSLGLPAKATGNFVAIYAWHHDIKHNQIWLLAVGEVQRFHTAARGDHLVPIPPENQV